MKSWLSNDHELCKYIMLYPYKVIQMPVKDNEEIWIGWWSKELQANLKVLKKFMKNPHLYCLYN